uniref:E3 ubiquitin-protein ligase E3D n=1 Tax=Setaria digitata TaxID=48799 RepID=A0A915PRL5_9BILA
MPLKSWKTRSFLIELKPRSEFASLFVDCPPVNAGEASCFSSQQTEKQTTKKKVSSEDGTSPSVSNELNERKEMVHIREHSIEVGSIVERRRNGVTELLPSYWAKFGDLTLYPNSVCALTWADNHRLFMCKVRVATNGYPLIPKTFHQLAVDVLSGMLLDEYIENAQSVVLQAECAECSATLFSYSKDCVKLQSLPEDGWLNTSPSMEYFCRDTCGGGSHSHVHHGAHASDFISSNDAQKQWLPNEERIVISDSYFLILKKMITSDTVTANDSSSVVLCAKCSVEIGVILKSNTDILQFSHVMCNLMATNERETYINARFGTLERFFAWTLLYQCESQTSGKLVLRSYDKRPYLLIWLLDSYVVISHGELAETEIEGEGNDRTVYSFPALKMLYKIFNAESAKTDPRANGEDASVGILDMPLTCCVKLTEMLLESSLALPPTGRSVGQFYVGFLKLKNVVD